MTSVNLPRRPAAAHLVCWVAAVLMAGLPAAACWADEPAPGLPLPPMPEDVSGVVAAPAAADPAPIRPAGFEQAAGRRPAADGPLPLSADAATPGSATPVGPLPPLGNWSLLLAIGGAFAMLGLFRLRTVRQAKALPPDVFELLGSASLGGPHAIRIVRFGPRTLLVGVSAAGCQTLAELDDPQTTERIVSACRGDRLAPRPVPVRSVATPRGPASGGEAA